jgi:uncharacterized protein with NRDE domain
LVIGANRDESYARPSAPPAEIEPRIVAGRDLEKGGTWLGLARGELFVAVTNRSVPAPTPTSYSRGQIALEALRAESLASVVAAVERRVDSQHVAGFNLVAIQGNSGVSFHFDGALRRTMISAGAHVVSADFDIDDPLMPEKSVFDSFAARAPGVPDESGRQARDDVPLCDGTARGASVHR